MYKCKQNCKQKGNIAWYKKKIKLEKYCNIRNAIYTTDVYLFWSDHYTLEGGSADSAVIATYCGEISSSVNSTSNKLYIQFRTDGSVGQRGFQLEYTVLYDYCKYQNMDCKIDVEYFTTVSTKTGIVRLM